jgi:hypothetical protein
MERADALLSLAFFQGQDVEVQGLRIGYPVVTSSKALQPHIACVYNATGPIPIQ